MRRIPASLSVHLLLGGASTRIGWWWIGIVAWFGFGAALVHLSEPTYSHRLSATIDRVSTTRHEGHLQYLVHFSYLDEDGVSRAGTSIADEEPSRGPRDVERDDSGLHSRLVGMQEAPEDISWFVGVLIADPRAFWKCITSCIASMVEPMIHRI